MKIIFKIVITALLFTISTDAISSLNPTVKIVVRGSDNYPPFEFKNEKGEPDGFNVELFRALMKTTKMPYDLELGDWDTAIDDMYNNRIDALLGMIYSESRAKNVRFCIPHCEINRNIICRKDQQYDNIDQLAGKEVMVQKGGWASDFISKHKTITNPILFEDLDAALKLLNSGKHDAAIGSDLVAMYLIKKNALENLQILPTKIEPQQYSIVVGHDNEMLLRLINVGLQQLKSSGEYDKIYNKWFGVYNKHAKIAPIIYISLAAAIAIIILISAMLYTFKQRIRKATKDFDLINTNLQLSLKAGQVSSWKYVVDTHTMHSMHGDTLVDFDTKFENFVNCLNNEDAKNFIQIINKLKYGEIDSSSIIIRYQGKDGSYSFYESEMISIKNKKSEVEYIIGTQHDVTQKHLLEIERQEVALLLQMAIKSTSMRVFHYDVRLGYFLALKDGEFVNTKSTIDTFRFKIHPDNVNRYNEIFSNLLNDVTTSEEAIIQIFNSEEGKYSYIECNFTAVKDIKGSVVKIAIGQRDITLKHLRKIEMESAYRSLNLAMEAAELIAWEYNLATQSCRILYGDKKHENINILDLEPIHPDDRAKYELFIQDITSGKSERRTTTIRKKDVDEDEYSYYECTASCMKDEKGNVTNIVGMHKNVTKRRATELAIIESNKKLKEMNKKNELILNNSNSGFVFIDNDYVVEWENISICTTSLSYEAYKKGEKCYKSTHKRDTPCENCVLELIQKTRQVETMEMTLATGNTIEVVGTPVINDKDEIEGTVIRVDDITQRKQIFSELANAKERAEESDRLKSAFLANMSHEIRTPLNAIVGFSELILTSDSAEECEEYSRIVRSNNELLLKLINDVLELSKIEAGHISLTSKRSDISSMMDDFAAMMRLKIHNGVELININPYSSCLVNLDTNRLAQVITNFLTNAAKFTVKGSITMGYECVDGGIRFYVSDTGIGISKENIDKVFARFEKLDDFAQGTGLGMTICKAIVEAMGGEIGLTSEKGVGSTFWAFFPCDPTHTNSIMDETPITTSNIATTVNDVAQTDDIWDSNHTILVVEDNQSNYMLVSSMLKNKYSISRAENGAIAVEMMQKGRYDAVLMDMKMPVMNGLEATAKIREFDTETPIIALTAHAFDADRDMAFEVGCTDYLTKPINKNLLLSTIRKYIC